MNNLNIYYRISDGSYKKNRLESATKENCFKNFINTFWHNVDIKTHIIIDGKMDWDIEKWFEEYTKGTHISAPIDFEHVSLGSGAKSFQYIYSKAILLEDENSLVYFVEDDYFHKMDSHLIIKEGLERANYVSLYDHPDKYINKTDGGNPFIESGGEVTRVIITDSTHWKLTNSTTMTFASKVKTLKEDKDIWFSHTDGTYPRDFEAFITLRKKGRSLMTPIPGYSTHTEIEWLSPLINWKYF